MLFQSLAVRPVTAAVDSAKLHETPSHSAIDSAQESFLRLSDTCYRVGAEVARRCSSRLPGLTDLYARRVLLVVGGQRSGSLGHYAPEKWAYNKQAFDEVHVNIGHEIYAAKSTREVAIDIVDTICHELAHLYARANGIKDTSGRGSRYHNKQFARLASQFCLRVVRSGRSHIGFQTVGLTGQGLELYSDVVDHLERELRLLPNYVPPTQDAPSESETIPQASTEVEVQKYVFANCSCKNTQGKKRTIRMARGWWIEGSIGCAICQHIFTESPPARTRAEASE